MAPCESQSSRTNPLRRLALAVAPCEFQSSPTNPLRGSCVSDRSRCGAVRISKLADEPSAGIVRVGALSLWRRPSAEIVRLESLSLWRRANLKARRRTLCGDLCVSVVFAKFKYKSSMRSALPHLRPENRKF